MASSNISFYFNTGAEIRWRHGRDFLRDAVGWRTMFYGATGCGIASACILSISLLLARHAYSTSGFILRCLTFSTNSPFYRREGRISSENRGSLHRAYLDEAHFSHLPSMHKHTINSHREPIPRIMRRSGVLSSFCLLMLLQSVRPSNSEYQYLSWTLPLSFLSDIGRENDYLSTEANPESFLTQCEFLAPPPKFDWLPADRLDGFGDWYEDSMETLHFSPAKDCLATSNLAENLLEPISTALRDQDIEVKHIILIKLESTRKDVFPLVKDSFMWGRIATTHHNNEIPLKIQEGLRQLTKTAEYLTGEDTGHEEQEKTKSRGGITASNAVTTSTYTLKSLVGSLCGILPLTADFNQEFDHHIYQPCLSHVLEAFNTQLTSNKQSDDFRTWPWKSLWLQAATDAYDGQELLTAALGFGTNETITRDTMIDPHAAHFPPKHENVNYFGLEDTEVEPYLRDAIRDAERKQERLFITHLTSTTHHPWALPEHFHFQKFLKYKGYGVDRMLNRYLNTIGYIDQWLAEILALLEETGIANKTLLVLAGDHGVSMPEDGSSTPYNNPHLGMFHIPLVFSHPALPSIQIDSPVSASQILPTILDLLISSSSLDKETSRVASDLLPLYEGQSLLRPLANTTEDGRPLWDFSVTNTGGASLAIRCRTLPFRMVMPMVSAVEWRFADLSTDPNELDPIVTFNWEDFLSTVSEEHGTSAVEWVEEAASVARWWLGQNRRLWHWEEDES